MDCERVALGVAVRPISRVSCFGLRQSAAASQMALAFVKSFFDVEDDDDDDLELVDEEEDQYRLCCVRCASKEALVQRSRLRLKPLSGRLVIRCLIFSFSINSRSLLSLSRLESSSRSPIKFLYWVSV